MIIQKWFEYNLNFVLYQLYDDYNISIGLRLYQYVTKTEFNSIKPIHDLCLMCLQPYKADANYTENLAPIVFSLRQGDV